MRRRNAGKYAKRIAAVLTAAVLTMAGAAPASAAYLETERESWEEFSEFYAEQWDKAMEDYRGNRGSYADIRLEAGDMLYSLLNSVADTTEGQLDFSWLKNIGLKLAETEAQDGVFELALGVYLNDTILATAQIPVDLTNNAIQFRVPEISEDYLGVPFEFENEESLRQWEHMKEVMNPEYLANIAPTGAQTADLLKRYGNLVLDGMTEEASYEETANVWGVEQSFTVHEGRMTEESLYHVIGNLLTTMRDDEQIKEMVENLGTFSEQESLYEEVQKNIDQELENWQDSEKTMEFEEDNYISSKIWLDEDGGHAGREITLYTDGSIDAQISWLGTRSEDHTGFRLFCNSGDGTSVLLSGGGDITDGRLNGNYEVRVNDKDALAIEVTDYDVNAEKGDLDGTYKVTYSGTDDEALGMFALLVDIDRDQAQQTSSFSLGISLSDEVISTLKMQTGIDDGLLTDLPDGGEQYRADDQEDLQKYLAGVHPDTIIENCRKAGVPDEFIGQVAELVTSLMESDSGSETQQTAETN